MNNLTGKSSIVVAAHQSGFVEFVRSNAYTSLTDMAKPFGKRVADWRKLKRTQKIIKIFKRDPTYNGSEPLIVIKGNLSEVYLSPLHSKYPWIGNTGKGGTWAHPDIAIGFAMWLDEEFQLWCQRQIRYLLTYGEVNIHYTEWTLKQLEDGQKQRRYQGNVQLEILLI